MPERRDVETKSGYVGNEFSLRIPAVLIENLPHIHTAPRRVARSAPLLFAKEASKQMDYILNMCVNCLGPERIVQPIRVVNVPVGESFRVIGEFLYYDEVSLKGTYKIHFLLLEGRDGEITEISKSSFDSLFIPNNLVRSNLDEVEIILQTISRFKSVDAVSVIYCPYPTIPDRHDIRRFIGDFGLEADIKVHGAEDACDDGSELTFLNPESYLTARYYFTEWQLYGQWLHTHKVTE